MQVGDKINDWTVVSFSKEKKFPSQKRSQNYWNCRCKCGTIKEFNEYYLRYSKATCCKFCQQNPISINVNKFFDSGRTQETVPVEIIDKMEQSEPETLKRSLVCNVGINDAPFKTAMRLDGKFYMHPAYRSWHNMINRCYSGKHPYYKTVKVSESWHKFSNFYLWWKINYKTGYDLDKDLLSGNLKIYSEETCLYVPHWLNIWIKQAEISGKFLPGFKINKKSGSYEFSFYAKGRGSAKKYLTYESLLYDWNELIFPEIRKSKQWEVLEEEIKKILEVKLGQDILK